MIDKKATFATINQVATLSLWTYGMAVELIVKSLKPELKSIPNLKANVLIFAEDVHLQLYCRIERNTQNELQ